MNKLAKYILLSGCVLLIYGYLAKAAGLYFFWESKYVGGIVMIVAIICFLLDRIRTRKLKAKRTILEKIIVGILFFALLVVAILGIVVPQTNAFKVAKSFLAGDEGLRNEIGEVKTCSFIPLGSMEVSTNREGSSGNAQMLFIVKGERKFREVRVYLQKSPGTEWYVVAMEK